MWLFFSFTFLSYGQSQISQQFESTLIKIKWPAVHYLLIKVILPGDQILRSEINVTNIAQLFFADEMCGITDNGLFFEIISFFFLNFDHCKRNEIWIDKVSCIFTQLNYQYSNSVTFFWIFLKRGWTPECPREDSNKEALPAPGDK